MESRARGAVDICISTAKRVVVGTKHLLLLTLFESYLQRTLALQHYRPVYSRSGRRNRIRH